MLREGQCANKCAHKAESGCCAGDTWLGFLASTFSARCSPLPQGLPMIAARPGPLSGSDRASFHRLRNHASRDLAQQPSVFFGGRRRSNARDHPVVAVGRDG
jgi:hypothetical protein